MKVYFNKHVQPRDPFELEHDTDLRGLILSGAMLGGANLVQADFTGTVLDYADLSGACLCGALLRGTSLQYADLRGAILEEAYLTGARFCGAKLAGAKLVGGVELVGDRPIVQVGPVGSRQDTLIAYQTSNGLYIETGCFFGPVAIFVAEVERKHGNNAYAAEYRSIVTMLKQLLY